MINILICDDNVNITNKVGDLLKEYQNKHSVLFDIDAENSSDFDLSGRAYDIAVVDIEMPKISGLKLSERLKKAYPDIIIIVLTSYQNYLDSAMKIKVFRYLSKPIDTERFYRNLNDAIAEYHMISKSINILFEDEVHRIKTKDILYIENLKYGSIIHTKRGDFKTNKKPKEWKKEIAQDECFAFSHHSILVNLQNVIDFDKTGVTLRKSDGETVSTYISQRKYTEFKKAFFRFAGGAK